MTRGKNAWSKFNRYPCSKFRRYEHFGEWNRVFPDPAMTLAAVDRLVHHATIFEMNVESYRRRSALESKRERGRPASFATIRNASSIDAPRQPERVNDVDSDSQHDNLDAAAT